LNKFIGYQYYHSMDRTVGAKYACDIIVKYIYVLLFLPLLFITLSFIRLEWKSEAKYQASYQRRSKDSLRI